MDKYEINVWKDAELLSKEVVEFASNEKCYDYVTEKPSWYVRFEDMSDRVLFKSRLLELLSMGFRKTVENFKAGKATTSSGGEARFWVVVFQDYEVRLQTKAQIMDVVTEGHRNREDEDNAKFERDGRRDITLD